MQKSPDDEYRRAAIAAARLRCSGLTQVEIARRLRRNQPLVSRLLAFAVKSGFISFNPTLGESAISKADWQAVEWEYFEHQKLAAAIAGLAPENWGLQVSVFRAGPEGYEAQVARRILELIHRSRCVGITWGGVLRRIVNHIVSESRRRRGAGKVKIEFAPLAGDPLFLKRHEKGAPGILSVSASALASDLYQAVNGASPETVPVLLGVPAYIARGFEGERKGGWREFISTIPSYQRIFGAQHFSPAAERRPAGGSVEEPLIQRLDLVLTGAGIVATGAKAEGATAAFLEERMAQEKLGGEAIQALVHGDIGGVLIEREGLTAAQRAQVERLRNGWTGLQEQDLAEIAARAMKAQTPGVVLAAAGAHKAELVARCLQRRLVNTLLVDEKLGKKLSDMAGK